MKNNIRRFLEAYDYTWQECTTAEEEKRELERAIAYVCALIEEKQCRSEMDQLQAELAQKTQELASLTIQKQQEEALDQGLILLQSIQSQLQEMQQH